MFCSVCEAVYVSFGDIGGLHNTFVNDVHQC